MPSYQRINAANVTRGPRGYKKIRHLSSTMIEGKFPLQMSDMFCIFVGINPDSATRIGKCWSSEWIMFWIWWIASCFGFGGLVHFHSHRSISGDLWIKSFPATMTTEVMSGHRERRKPRRHQVELQMLNDLIYGCLLKWMENLDG